MRSIRWRASCLGLAAGLFLAAFPLAPAARAEAVTVEPPPADSGNADDFATYWEANREEASPVQEMVLSAVNHSTLGGGATVNGTGEEAVLTLPAGGYAEWKVQAQKGLYRIALTYQALGEEDVRHECAVALNGAAPFQEAQHISLSRVWRNDGEKTTDNQGNDVSPKQVPADVWNTADLNGADNIAAACFYFGLNEGENTLRLSATGGELQIKAVRVYNPADLPTYEAYVQEHAAQPQESADFQQKIEAEDAVYKSSSNLYPMSDRSGPSVSPSDPIRNRLNYIGGESWGNVGQWISWEINVPADGYYTLNFKYKQNVVRGLKSRRRLTIDGEVPFKEMENLTFSYSDSWSFLQPGGEEPYRFYLTKGRHEIRLESILGDLTDTLSSMNRSLLALNELYRRIIMITGVTPDPYNDYFLHTEIPELLDTFERVSLNLRENAQTLEESSDSAGSAASSLYDIVRQLDSFREKPNTIPQRLDSYRSNISVLADLLLSLKQQPLTLDYLSVSSVDQPPVTDKTNIFDVIVFRLRAFLASFRADYASLGNQYASEEEPLDVWISANDLLATGVSSGRDQATVLKRFIDEQFTLATGIAVNLSLVSTSDTLLQAIVGHKEPDAAIFVPKTMPVTLAMRGGVADLSDMPQFSSWKERVYASAFIPYQYNGGVYGMPETQVFNVLYFRRDVFEELGLTPPDTWEDFYRVTSIIQGNNLQVGVPADQTTLEMLLLQNGESLYNEDLSRVALSTPDAIQAFGEWTDLYTQYGIPLQYDFFNRFRTGEMPMAIAPLTMYSQLSVAAPEIANQWEMAPIPATVKDGESSRAQGCITTASVVMQNSPHKENACRFIDWWTSDEIQAQFGNSMENRMGAAARYNTANKKAFERLPWNTQERELLRGLWTDVTDIPQTPASYYVNRNILNAFRRVVYYNETPREVINKYAQDMNEELIRKRQEFGLE